MKLDYWLQYGPLILNLALFLVYLYTWQEPGKILYWLGATILIVGVILMKG